MRQNTPSGFATAHLIPDSTLAMIAWSFIDICH